MSNLIIDPTHLGDQHLNASEALIKVQEERWAADEQFRLPDQAHLTDVAARWGRAMLYTDFIRKVEAITGKRVFAEASWLWPDGWNFYTLRRGGEKVCLGAAFEKPKDGFLPEFSYIQENALGHPEKEYRGWRTLLYRLIAAKAISKAQADKAFGRAYENESSQRWQLYTRQFA